MIQTLSFYLISGILVFSSLMVVTQRSLFTCALYLAVALSTVAGFFVLLGADFLAGVQILLYVGGILVILAFAVMLSSVLKSKAEPQTNPQSLPSFLTSCALVLLVLAGIWKTVFGTGDLSYGSTTEGLGRLLLRDMTLPFELISLVLLASLAGAVLFSRRESPSA